MTYKEIVNDDKPVLVNFTASWCGPCKSMAPVLAQLKEAVGDSGRIVKIDIDKHQQLAGHLGVRAVPTFIMYKKGEIIWRESGAQSGNKLYQLFQQNM